MPFDDIATYAVGSHAWFFRENDAFTLPAPGFAGVSALPGPLDAGWIYAGDIETWEDHMAQDEEKEVRKPNPGVLVRKDIITIFQGLDIKLVTNSLTKLSMEAMYRSATQITADETQFVPLSATPARYWLMLQRYTHDNQPWFAANLWVRMKVTGGYKGGNGELQMPEYTCRLLNSDLNTAQGPKFPV
jgi:hypothetical protein